PDPRALGTSSATGPERHACCPAPAGQPADHSVHRLRGRSHPRPGSRDRRDLPLPDLPGSPTVTSSLALPDPPGNLAPSGPLDGVQLHVVRSLDDAMACARWA